MANKDPGKLTRIRQVIHNNLRFNAIPSKDGSKAKLEVNYEDAAMALLIEQMYEMKEFYENLQNQLLAAGHTQAMSIVADTANEYKILDFIKEVK